MCTHYAEMLRERSEPNDQGRAIAQELSMKPLLERVLAQQEMLKA